MNRFSGLAWSPPIVITDVLAMPVEQTPPGRLIYAIHDDDVIYYIGQTFNHLGVRLGAHARGPQARELCRMMKAARYGDRTLKASWVPHVSGLEGRLIGALRPRFNKLHPRWINVHGRDLPDRRAA